MKKILLSIAVVALVSAVSVKATGAFFTDSIDSLNNNLTAGTLTIDVLDQNLDTQFVDETLKANWQPGEEVSVSFDVKNTGSVPLQLRGYAAGAWSNPALDANKVKVTRVERWNGSAWEDVLAANPAGYTGFFYYTNDGLVSGTFVNVATGERAQFKLTVKLDETADNTYQSAVFTSALHVEARQATTPTTVWP